MNAASEPIFDFVMRSLAATRGRWPDVAEGAGVAISTLRKIAQGQIEDPAVSKVQALADYFHKNPAKLPDESPPAETAAGSH